MMLVMFNEKLHYVFQQHDVISPNTHTTGKKRKASTQLQTVYFVADCTNLDDRFMVNAADCTEVESDIDYYLSEALEEFLKEKHRYLKCSYATSPDKNYYISTVDKLMQDGMIVTLRCGEVRHFKYAKMYIACGDGVTNDYCC
jgi:hypothetical protein